MTLFININIQINCTFNQLPSSVINFGTFERYVRFSWKECGVIKVEPILHQYVVFVHGSHSHAYYRLWQFLSLWTL